MPPLYVTDDQIIELLGVPKKMAQDAIRVLDHENSGFPKKQKLWGDRRYWPKVKEWLDSHNNLKTVRDTDAA